MADYPYILKTGSLKKFLEKIPTVGVPDKITYQFLYTLDFKGTNDRPIIPILKFLKFADASGVPTERYKSYRDKSKSAKILGEALKQCYLDLFKVYPDANKRDPQSLQNFFTTKTGLGERAVKSIVETFKALCSVAEFSAVAEKEEEVEKIDNESTTTNKSTSHNLELALNDGRKAKMVLPHDITHEEIERLKKQLDVFK